MHSRGGEQGQRRAKVELSRPSMGCLKREWQPTRSTAGVPRRAPLAALPAPPPMVRLAGCSAHAAGAGTERGRGAGARSQGTAGALASRAAGRLGPTVSSQPRSGASATRARSAARLESSWAERPWAAQPAQIE